MSDEIGIVRRETELLLYQTEDGLTRVERCVSTGRPGCR